MDRHHDQIHFDPADHDAASHDADWPGIEEQLAERVADPGRVRPAVWCTAPAEQPGCLSPRLARLLLEEYTRVGDVVLDVDDDVAFAATAAASGRRHHALGGAHHLAVMGHATGYIDLILLHWPRPAVNPHWLLQSCRALLRTSGRLAIAVSVAAHQRVAHLGALTGAAATCGLRLVEHVAVLAPRAATSPAADPERGHPGGHAADRASAAYETHVHGWPHTDLLILGAEADVDE